MAWPLHSPSRPLNFLAQNCIRLEPGSSRARRLDFLVQNVGPFTTPSHTHQFLNSTRGQIAAYWCSSNRLMTSVCIVQWNSIHNRSSSRLIESIVLAECSASVSEWMDWHNHLPGRPNRVVQVQRAFIPATQNKNLWFVIAAQEPLSALWLNRQIKTQN